MSDSDSSIPQKTCSVCGREFPATTEFFYAKKSGRLGLEGRCRICRKESDRAYYLANQDKRKAYARQQSRTYYREHRAQVLTRCREYQKAHLERYAELAREERARDPEKVRKYQRAYIAANREKHNEKAHRRRALVAGATGDHTAADIRAQVKRQKGKCFYCGCKLGHDYHREHVTPLSLGGSNGPENIVVACPACNLKKAAKHPMDFAGILF